MPFMVQSFLISFGNSATFLGCVTMETICDAANISSNDWRVF